MNNSTSKPAKLILIGLVLFHIPFVIWGASPTIISYLAPGDPNPQAAMVYFGLFWLASCVIFGIPGIVIAAIGFIKLCKMTKANHITATTPKK